MAGMEDYKRDYDFEEDKSDHMADYGKLQDGLETWDFFLGEMEKVKRAMFEYLLKNV